MLLFFIGRQGHQVQIQSEVHECAHHACGVANEGSTASVPVVLSLSRESVRQLVDLPVYQEKRQTGCMERGLD